MSTGQGRLRVPRMNAGMGLIDRRKVALAGHVSSLGSSSEVCEQCKIHGDCVQVGLAACPDPLGMESALASQPDVRGVDEL